MINAFAALVVLAMFAFLVGYAFYRKDNITVSDDARNYRIIKSLAWIKRFGFILSLLVLFLYGVFASESVPVQKDKEVILVDVSNSMLTEDGKEGESRIGMTKKTILDNFFPLLIQTELLAFKGETRILLPATLDAQALQDEITNLSEESASWKWSNIVDALQFAYASFGSKQSGTIYLFSDWDDRPIDLLPLKVLQKSHPNVTISVIWVGSSEGGKIPVGKSPLWDSIYLRGTDGNEIVTKLNDTSLKDIAGNLDGSYTAIWSFRHSSIHLPGYVRNMGNYDFGAKIASLILLLSILLPYRIRVWKND